MGTIERFWPMLRSLQGPGAAAAPRAKPVAPALRALLMRAPAQGLLPDEQRAVEEYFMAPDVAPLDKQRRSALRWMSERACDSLIVSFGKRHLFEGDESVSAGTGSASTPSLIPSASLRELRRFLYALIRTSRLDELDVFMHTLMAQWGIPRRERAVDLCGVVLLQMAKAGIPSALQCWAKWIALVDGGCEFTEYARDRNVLRPVLRYMQGLVSGGGAAERLCTDLDSVRTVLGPTAATQLASTLISLAAFNQSFDLVEALWDYKEAHTLPVTTVDLTQVMRSYNYSRKFEREMTAYNSHPEAHHDAAQFDYLLLAHSKTMSWAALKQQFDALFGIGKLPNVRHYEIVMYAMAMLGNVQNIEALYSQFLRRGMVPTYPIIQALLECHYKSSDPTSCFEQFQLFERYSIQPTAASYTVMFSVYQKLNDISGALRLLRTMTEEDTVPVREQHFLILMRMCARVTNHLIAREIFNIMRDHYDILPHPHSVAALMDVYTEAGLPHEAMTLYNRYRKERYIRNDTRFVAICVSALRAQIRAGDPKACLGVINFVDRHKVARSADYYKALLQYQVSVLRDLEAAEQTFSQLLDEDSDTGVKANTGHFEVMMNAYAHIDYHDRVYNLYETMTDRNIPVNSKILYNLVKATFKVQMSKKEDLTKSLQFLDRIMSNAASQALNTTSTKFHPSVMGWALRAVAKYYSPKKALEVLDRYDELFYDKNVRSVNNKFTLMRSLAVLFAELGDWNQFEIMYDNVMRQIERYQRQPTSTITNKRLNALFVGTFSYKIRQLEQTHQIEKLPGLIRSLGEQGFVLDNVTWNDAIVALSSNDKTIRDALYFVDKFLVHGYNSIHQGRLLGRLRSSPMSASASDSWYLEKKRQDSKSLIPKRYLLTETNEILCRRLDDYLSKQDDAQATLRELVDAYGYYMKGYLMHRRNNVVGWDAIEREHASFFQKLRSTKRVVPAQDF